MSEYIVRIPYCVWQSVRVEAESEDEAEALAMEEAGLSGYCGNGGSNKLIGVTGDNNSVEACDEPLDELGMQIEVEQI